MVSVANSVVDQTWEQVSRWPQEWRLSFAKRLLHSIHESESGSATSSGCPGDLVGVWKVANAPSDGEVEQILEEERQRKHG